MKKIFYILLLYIPIYSFACECVTQPFMTVYQNSDFIARVKISKVSDDLVNPEYRNVNIQILELFKGKKVTSLKQLSDLQNMCGITTPENTVWLLFASYDKVGNLYFNLCSGSVQIENVAFDQNHPNDKKNREAQLSLTLEVLTYLTKKNVKTTDKIEISHNFVNTFSEDLKGFKNSNQQFSVYELTVQKDLSISKYKALIEFSNKRLAQNLFTHIKQTTVIKTPRIKQIPSVTKVMLIYFYYPAVGNDKSFITTFLL